MDIGILGISGFVFALTTTGVLVYEHETDVLHGAYVAGRARTYDFAAIIDPVRAVVDDAMERFAWKVGDLMDRLAWHIGDLKQRLAWKVRNAVYLAMMA
jgi:hypothetical protein